MSHNLFITIIQSNLFWEDKAANLAMFEEKINNIKNPSEIVILPEMFSTGFSMNTENLAETMDGNTIQWMQKIAQQKKIILTGSLIIKEDNKFYNRSIWMLPNKQIGYYDKRHCFSYANEHKHYTPGNKRLIASVKGWKLNLQICYDLRFPVWARQTPNEENKGEAEYDVLLYVANWPQRRNTAWKTLLAARAIENQCYVIGVNRVGEDGNNIYYSGDSMIVSPLGEVLYYKENEEDIFTIELKREDLQNIRSKFSFLSDGDFFKIIT